MSHQSCQSSDRDGIETAILIGAIATMSVADEADETDDEIVNVDDCDVSEESSAEADGHDDNDDNDLDEGSIRQTPILRIHWPSYMTRPFSSIETRRCRHGARLIVR